MCSILRLFIIVRAIVDLCCSIFRSLNIYCVATIAVNVTYNRLSLVGAYGARRRRYMRKGIDQIGHDLPLNRHQTIGTDFLLYKNKITSAAHNCTIQWHANICTDTIIERNGEKETMHSSIRKQFTNYIRDRGSPLLICINMLVRAMRRGLPGVGN